MTLVQDIFRRKIMTLNDLLNTIKPLVERGDGDAVVYFQDTLVIQAHRS